MAPDDSPARPGPSDLASRRCVPCEGGAEPLPDEEVRRLAPSVPAWDVADGKLVRRVEKKAFRPVMALVNRIADLAEEEGHHPDFCVHYARLDLTLWTHAVGGLSENDFILAAKIDRLIDESEGA